MIILIYIFIKHKFTTLLDVILRTHLLKYFPPNYLNAIDCSIEASKVSYEAVYNTRLT